MQIVLHHYVFIADWLKNVSSLIFLNMFDSPEILLKVWQLKCFQCYFRPWGMVEVGTGWSRWSRAQPDGQCVCLC